jgi:hypothetical protein
MPGKRTRKRDRIWKEREREAKRVEAENQAAPIRPEEITTADLVAEKTGKSGVTYIPEIVSGMDDGEGGKVIRPAEIAIARRAIREDWPLEPEKRNQLMEELYKVAMTKPKIVAGAPDPGRAIRVSSTTRVLAMRTLVMADGINAKREQIDVTAARANLGVKVNVNVGVSVSQHVQAAVAAEPEYLEWLRERAYPADRDADALGRDDLKTEILTADACQGDGQGGDGHDSGN